MSEFNQIDSCGHCGESMSIMSTCMVCDKPAQFQCSNCCHFVDDPIHTQCVIIDDSF